MPPLFEPLPAHTFQLNGQCYLATGDKASSLAVLGDAAFAPTFIRYAFPQYGTQRPFFVTLVADDRGQLYRGFDAIDWLIAEGLLHPRSDAQGVWPDGATDQLFIKELDLAVPLLAFACRSETDFPGLHLTAAIQVVENATFALAPGGNFPARLLSAVPVLQLNAALPFSKTIPLIPQVLATSALIPLDTVNDLPTFTGP